MIHSSTSNHITTRRRSHEVYSSSMNRIRTTTRAVPPLQVTSSSSSNIITTQEELDEYAEQVGVTLTFSTLGPGYRAVARAAHDEEQILGYCEGFLRPGECVCVNMM